MLSWRLALMPPLATAATCASYGARSECAGADSPEDIRGAMQLA